MSTLVIAWLAFAVFVALMLAVDFYAFSGRVHKVGIKEALIWSVVWIVIALAFNAGVYFFEGKERAVNFLTGYLVERALSMDNIFVFLLIFNYFKVPPQFQQGSLFWGIIGALVMRGIFIAAGIAIINLFHWTIYILGAFLIYVGVRLFFQREKEIDLEKNFALRFARKLFRITGEHHEDKFFVRKDGARWATPLFVVMVLIMSMDLVFAVDSIPAILAITTDPFVVYTSNVFAVLGLRALYFAIAALTDMFRYLNFGLAFILVLVGLKMVASDIFPIPVVWTLSAVVLALAVSVFMSVLIPKK